MESRDHVAAIIRSGRIHGSIIISDTVQEVENIFPEVIHKMRSTDRAIQVDGVTTVSI